MRTLAASATTLLASGRPIPKVLLVEMQLNATIYLCSASADISWNGQTWVGVGPLGMVSAVNDSVGEMQPLDFTLLAADPAMIAIALDEDTRGKKVIVRCMLLDPDTGAILDVQTAWTGTLEPMAYEGMFGAAGVHTPTIKARAEHGGVTMRRATPLRYTDADQQRLHSGDISLQYVVANSQRDIMWPARSFFKQ